MSRIVVRPDVSRLIEVASRLSGEEKELFEKASGHIGQVEVDDAGFWRVHLISNGRGELSSERLAKLLQEAFGVPIQLIEEPLAELWPVILSELESIQPGVMTAAGGLEVTADGHRLCLSARTEAAQNALTSKGVLESLQLAVRKVLGPDWEVVEAGRTTARGSGASASVASGSVADARPGMEVSLTGMVLWPQEVSLRTGRRFWRFGLTDKKDTIIVKTRPGKPLHCQLREGSWVTVYGDIAEDKFEGEPVCVAKKIEMAEVPERRDDALQKRTELHLHTTMSAMDSVVQIEKLFEVLSSWGHKAVAITDHGVVQAFPEAFEEACRRGLKLIFGMEGYLVENDWRDAKPFHIILLAKNQAGLKQLYKLVSDSHIKFYHRVPRLPRRLLAENRGDLLVGSACQAGELYQAILSGANEEKLREIASFYDYLEVQPLGNNAFLIGEGKVASEDDLREINRRVVRLGAQLGIPVVATCDVHFIHPEDAVFRDVLMATRGDEHSEKPAPLFLRTTGEMLREFEYLGPEVARQVVVDGPNAIVDRIEHVEPVPKGLHQPKIEKAEEQIAKLAMDEAIRLYGSPLPETVAKRLDKELGAIQKHGFSVIYLIAQMLVKKSMEQGYLVGSRGSVGSSLVARLAGITEVNPLPPHYMCPQCRYSEFPVTDVGSGIDLPRKDCPKCGHEMVGDGHDIPFEVFLGFKGDKVPDIDLNFSGEIQASIHRYTEEILGKGNVFRAGTIATVADRTAYGLVRAYADSRNLILRKAEIERLARGITGVKRTTGQHPGGVMVVPQGYDVLQFTPVQYPADDRRSGVVTTHFDYDSISSRLVKLDILGHDDPTALKLLQEYTGQDPMEVPLNDPSTLQLFSGADPVGTVGIPEFGTRFVRQMLAETKPKSFAELVRISGLSHGTDVWLGNARDLIREGVATLREVICTRDDIMIFLMSRGVEPGTAFAIMESVRKGKGISEEQEAAMRGAGVPEWYIQSCKKIRYMFPKAHAVAYVMMSFRIAYFKVHYPQAFYAMYFTLHADALDSGLLRAGPKTWERKCAEIWAMGPEASQKDKETATLLEVAVEMNSRGIEFLPVHLYASHPWKCIIEPNGIRLPLLAMPGLGRSAAAAIEAARRERPFLSVDDLKARARLSKSIVELLKSEGCLAGMPETNQMALWKQ